MNWAYVVVGIVVAVILSGGLVLGALLFVRAPEAPEPVVEHVVVDLDGPEPEPAEPLLEARGGGEETAALRDRVARLESEVRELKARLDKARAEREPLVELYKKALESGGIPGPGVMPGEMEGFEVEGELVSGPKLARMLAGKIGLDETRKAAFQKQFEKTLAEIEALEKLNATVSSEGDTTTIKISRFGADGESLRRDWSDWVRANLSSDEAAAYKKEGGDNRLFSGRMGGHERTVKIKEAGGNITLREMATGEDGSENVNETMGPAEARDFVLEGYLHLLK